MRPLTDGQVTNSSPDPSGRPRSLTTKSNDSRSTVARASARVAAVATRLPRRIRRRESTVRVRTSSSTSRIRRGDDVRRAPSLARPSGMASGAASRVVAAADRGNSSVNVAPRPFPVTQCREAAAMGLGDPTSDSQAEAKSAGLFPTSLAALLERLEDRSQQVAFDARPRIRHLDSQACTTFALAFAPGRLARANRDRPARRRELGRVLDEVPDDLLQPRRVGLQESLEAARSNSRRNPPGGSLRRKWPALPARSRGRRRIAAPTSACRFLPASRRGGHR